MKFKLIGSKSLKGKNEKKQMENYFDEYDGFAILDGF